MSKVSLFSKERLVYWPAEFADVMRQLTGLDAEGRPTGRPSMYSFNTGAMTLAATIGVVNKRTRDVGSDRKEISTATFASHGLEAYIYLVAMLAAKDATVDQLRPEQEEEAIRTFERYAAGGLEMLRAEFADAPTQSPDYVVERLMTQRKERATLSEVPKLI